MKTETLRVSHLKLQQGHAYLLKDVSFSFMEGESVGFWGLSNSGKDALFKVICGVCWPDQGSIHVQEQYMPNAEALKGKVHRISALNYLINNWTVAEYIGLMSGKAVGWHFNQTALNRSIKTLLDAIHLDIDPRKELRHLSEIEKRLMDLAKAYYNPQIRILAVEDEFEGCTVEEMKRFRAVMDTITDGRMTVVINAFSDTVNQILSDQYIIFQGGTILKKVKKTQLGYKEYINSYLSDLFRDDRPGKEPGNEQPAEKDESQEVYAVANLPLTNRERVSLSFSRYKTATLLVLNKREKERVFGLLSGRIIDKTVLYSIRSQPFHGKNIADFIRHKVVSCAHLGTSTELMQHMTVGENVILPSLTKIDTQEYLLWGHKMMAMLEEQAKLKYQVPSQGLLDRGTLSRIAVVFERWYVYAPDVLLLLEPFLQCDAYGVSMIKAYIKQFTQNGTAVIIVTSCAEHIEDVSDSLVNLEYIS